MNDTQKQIDELKRQLESLTSEYYTNNFSALQDFNKYSRFNSRLRIPVYASAPTSAEVGELYYNTGTSKLYVCTVGSQTSPTWTAQT